MKRLKIQMNGRSDEFQTPEEAIIPLLPYLNKEFNVWGNKDNDFVKGIICPPSKFCIITNPPYSMKEEFLERCYRWKVPFALLMPLTALEGKRRGELYRKYRSEERR